MKDNFEFRFHPVVYNKHLGGIHQDIQVRTGMFWLWFVMAYQVINLTTGKIIKNRI